MDLRDGPLCPLHRFHSVSHSVLEKEPLKVPRAGHVLCIWTKVPRLLHFSQEGEEWAFPYPTGFERSLSSRHSLWVGQSFEDPTALFASKEAAP